MNKEDNLKKRVPFKINDPRINRKGRPIGALSRDTILKKWLASKVDEENPETGELEKVSLQDKVILALIKKATDGDVPAIKEIQDTLYGKLKDQSEITGMNGKELFPAVYKVTYEQFSKEDE